jgi:hypothetical protein
MPLGRDLVAVLRPGGDLHLHALALEDPLDGHRAAEHRLDGRDGALAEEVVPLAREAGVVGHVDADDEVAAAIAPDARLAAPLDLELLAGVDAGGDLDLDGLVAGGPPLPAAGLARLVDHMPRAMAVGARGLRLHRAEDGALHLHHAARPMAAPAGPDGPARGDARAAAVVAGGEPLVGDGLLAAARGLGERDVERDAHVAAARARRPAAPRGGPAEERGEDVVHAEAAEDVAHVDVVPAAEAAGAVWVAELVVVLPPPLVGEDGVGLVHLLELLLRVWGVGDVGVDLARLLEEGALDGALVGVTGDAEHLVVVIARLHCSLFLTNLVRGCRR